MLMTNEISEVPIFRPFTICSYLLFIIESVPTGEVNSGLILTLTCLLFSAAEFTDADDLRYISRPDHLTFYYL